MFKKLKYLAVLASALVCLAGTVTARSQAVFYNNTADTNIFFQAVGDEIAMPIAFSGTYEVDSFRFGYFLPLDSVNGPTTDVIVNFYTAAQPVGDVSSGYDSIQQYYTNLVSSTRLTNLPSEPSGLTNIVNYDLTPNGDFFNWTAGTLLSGEDGGYVSLTFTNPDAGWELATGDSQDDYFQDVTTTDVANFGGAPQAAFYIQLAGQNLTPQAPPDVPEPGNVALFVGLFVPGCAVFLKRRVRHA